MQARAHIATGLAAALALGAVAAFPGAAPAAGSRPDAVVEIGRTLAVQDGPGGGGVALGFSLLWPLEHHFRLGLMAYADALGERTDRLIGPGGVDLGPVTGVHRAARGAAVRLEAHLPGRHALEPHVSATWGYSRVQDDVRGDPIARGDATGSGLGVGVVRRLNEHHAIGIAVRSQLLARAGGGAGHYLNAALEWRWGVGAGN
jgi:hypothetical protein